MATTEGRILDLLAGAVAMWKTDGLRGARSVWASMTEDEQVAWDFFLVRTRDGLSWAFGKPEARFLARVVAMATNTPASSATVAQITQHIEHGRA